MILVFKNKHIKIRNMRLKELILKTSLCHVAFWSYFAGHSFFDKKLYGSVEVVVVRNRDSVAERHRTECETMPNPTQAPGAARSVG